MDLADKRNTTRERRLSLCLTESTSNKRVYLGTKKPDEVQVPDGGICTGDGMRLYHFNGSGGVEKNLRLSATWLNPELQ